MEIEKYPNLEEQYGSDEEAADIIQYREVNFILSIQNPDKFKLTPDNKIESSKLYFGELGHGSILLDSYFEGDVVAQIFSSEKSKVPFAIIKSNENSVAIIQVEALHNETTYNFWQLIDNNFIFNELIIFTKRSSSDFIAGFEESSGNNPRLRFLETTKALQSNHIRPCQPLEDGVTIDGLPGQLFSYAEAYGFNASLFVVVPYEYEITVPDVKLFVGLAPRFEPLRKNISDKSISDITKKYKTILYTNANLYL